MSKDVMVSGEHDLNLLAAYIENRLGAVEHARVVSHLAACVQCRSTLAAYARASVSASDTAGSSGHVQKWLRQTGVWVPVAAAVMVTTLTIVGVLRLGNADREPRAASPKSPTGIRSQSEAIQAPSAEGDLSRRRSGERVVEGRMFRLVAGEWIDEAYDPLAALPEVEVRSPEQRAALLQRTPALRPFAALGPRVIVVHAGTVYKFGPDPLQ